MLKLISEEQLERLLKREFPYWNKQSYNIFAKRMIAEIDERLDSVIMEYFNDSVQVDFEFNEFSIKEIQQLRRCSYMEAIMLMDEYLKDENLGRMKILHR